ncbi:MAG TPA: hypothetical protein VNO21_18320 [Polyangiaceae bacterium]|nr:hypothetical protein [Polyangiaceae bacterium]
MLKTHRILLLPALLFVPLLTFIANGCGGSDNPSGPVIPGDGGAGDGSELASCSGVDLQKDGVLDLDVKSAKITGVITLNGTPVTKDTDGGIAFIDRKTGSRTTVAFGPSYQVVLAQGDYDVLYSPSATCDGTGSSPTPCIEGVVKRAVSFTQSGKLDIDIPTVTITGAVTLNGKALPDASDRGSLAWTAKDGGLLTFALGNTGAKTYALTLVPGTYSVALAANATPCNVTVSASEMPCVGGPLKTDITLAQNGKLDVDIPSVRITGNITMNKGVLPDLSEGRGDLRFSLEGGAYASMYLGDTGAKTFALSVLAGNYAIDYLADSTPTCLSGQVPSGNMPCASAPLRQHVALTTNGNMDLDIPVVQVTGAITYRGQPMDGDAGKVRGYISWDSETDSGKYISMGSSGPASFSIPLVAGTYSLAYSSNDEMCNDTWTFPCAGGTFKSNVAITKSGTLDVDVPAVRISGNVTLGGRALPDEIQRGGLLIDPDNTQKDGTTTPVSFTDTGPVSFTRWLVPGSYTVRYLPGGACEGSTLTQFPCAGGILKSGAALTQDGNLDIDIPAISIRGKVTLDGKPMPDATDWRAALLFGAVDRGGESNRIALLSKTGDAQYVVTLLPAHYLPLYYPNSTLCSADSPFPCTNEVLKGCP